MKKLAAIMLAVVLCVGTLAGCGKDYSANESTVFVLKNGKVVSTDVEDFGSSYDQKALEKYIDDSISTYNDENGKDSVKLKKLSIEKKKATLILEYASTDDYKSFNGIDLFAGTVTEALAAGYDFNVDFASIKDSKATECSKDQIIDSSDLKVVIYNGTSNINVNGTIAYASVDSTKLVDKSTVAISNEYNLLNKAIDASTETEKVEEAVSGTEGTEAESADSGSVSADDLLEDSTQSEEVTFDFSDEPKEDDSVQTYSDVYTYVVYE